MVQASDLDHWTDPRTGQSGYESDTLTYQWTCTVGSFWKETGTTPHATWIAPNSPQTGVVIKVRVDDSNLPGRDDPYVELTWTITAYKVACYKIEATYDVDIYWPDEPHYSDKVWEADRTQWENNGNIVEIWHREHIADIFRPAPQHYRLQFFLATHPACTPGDAGQCTTYLTIFGSQVSTVGWDPPFWMTDRSSIGWRSYDLSLRFSFDGRTNNTQARIPVAPEKYFRDYAIYDTPKCDDPADFCQDHLAHVCTWAENETQVIKDGIPYAVQRFSWKRALSGYWSDNPWELETRDDGDCEIHAYLVKEALWVLGVWADACTTDPADMHSPYCRVGDVRWCATHQTWEWRWFWPVLVQQQWDYEAVCKVPLVDEAAPWDCFYDKGMGPVGEESQEYQRGTYDGMWFEYKDQPPPHHMVIDRYFWWQNHP